MSEWIERSLEDITIKVTDGSHQSPKSDPSGLPMFSVKDMQEYGFDFNGCKRISRSDYDFLVTQGCQPVKGDVLIAKDGSVMKHVFVVKKNIEAVLLSSIAIVKPNQSVIDSDFLSYFLKAPQNKASIISNYISGAGVPRIILKDFKRIKVRYPEEISKQKTISSFLLSIDNKIEVSQRMNETLEAMAMALFKSWFVDFDPVHAKAEGRKPMGMDAAMAALFPAAFNDGGLPEGWRKSRVIDAAEYINGAAYKNMHFSDAPNALPVIKIVEMKNGISAQTKFTNTELGDKYKIDTGDILFSWSGSPDTSIDTFIWTGGKGWLNQHIFKVINDKKSDRCFTYWLLKYLKPIFVEIARDKQTTGLGHVTRKDMERLSYSRSTPEIIEIFYQIAGPIMDRIQANMTEEIVLSKTRDALLLKLITGEINIKN